jgi:hypothetical protein
VVRCSCGYHSERLVSAAVFGGVSEVFTCLSCREVVSAFVSGTGYDRGFPAGPVTPKCGHCGGTELVPFGGGDVPVGPCPRCGKPVQTELIGIAD